jgi:hypothetical protein
MSTEHMLLTECYMKPSWGPVYPRPVVLTGEAESIASPSSAQLRPPSLLTPCLALVYLLGLGLVKKRRSPEGAGECSDTAGAWAST